jgi:hypothetical protein
MLLQSVERLRLLTGAEMDRLLADLDVHQDVRAASSVAARPPAAAIVHPGVHGIDSAGRRIVRARIVPRVVVLFAVDLGERDGGRDAEVGRLGERIVSESNVTRKGIVFLALGASAMGKATAPRTGSGSGQAPRDVTARSRAASRADWFSISSASSPVLDRHRDRRRHTRATLGQPDPSRGDDPDDPGRGPPRAADSRMVSRSVGIAIGLIDVATVGQLSQTLPTRSLSVSAWWRSPSGRSCRRRLRRRRGRRLPDRGRLLRDRCRTNPLDRRCPYRPGRRSRWPGSCPRR